MISSPVTCYIPAQPASPPPPILSVCGTERPGNGRSGATGDHGADQKEDIRPEPKYRWFPSAAMGCGKSYRDHVRFRL